MPTGTLHVIDAHGPGEALVPAMIQHVRTHGGQVALLCGAEDASLIRRAGLGEFHRVAPPLRRGELAGPALRALTERLRPDRLVAWSPASAVAGAWTRRPSVVVVGAPPVRCSALARVVTTRALKDGRAVTVGPGARDAWLAACPATRHAPHVEEAPCATRPAPEARAAVRAGWGADDDRLVVGLLDADGRSGPTVDAFFVSFVVGMMSMLGREVLAIAPPGARGLERGKRQMERHGDQWRVVPERRPPWAWAVGCDVLVSFGGEGVAGGWAEQIGAALLPVAPEWHAEPGRITTRRPREAAAELLRTLDRLGGSRPRPARGDFSGALDGAHGVCAVTAPAPTPA